MEMGQQLQTYFFKRKKNKTKWKVKRRQQFSTVLKSSWPEGESLDYVKGLGIISKALNFCPLFSWLHFLNHLLKQKVYMHLEFIEAECECLENNNIPRNPILQISPHFHGFHFKRAARFLGQIKENCSYGLTNHF